MLHFAINNRLIIIVASLFLFAGCGEPKNANNWIDSGDGVKLNENKSKKSKLKGDEEMGRLLNLQALESCNRGNYLKAISLFEKAIKRDPKSKYFNNLGRALYWSGESRLAIKAFKKAQRNMPNDALLIANLGDVYKQNKQYRLAIEHYHKALSLNPNLVRAHYELGELYLRQGQAKDAEYRLNKAFKLAPTQSNILLKLVILWHITGRNEKAWEGAKVLERRGLKLRDDLLNKIGAARKKGN